MTSEKDEIQTDITNEETPIEENVNGEETAADQAAEPVTAADGDSKELQDAKALADDNYQRYLRAQADFDNFRRRTLKEKEDLAKFASMKLVSDLVPVLDNFERAIAANTADSASDSFTKGVDMIYRQFLGVLEQEGLAAMNAVGQPFNPELHQAVMQVDSDEYEEGTVVEELQKGYTLKERVLRPAMVKVSK